MKPRLAFLRKRKTPGATGRLLSILFSLLACAASAQTLQTLYSFTDSTNGQNPYAGLTLGKDGNFYGTTRAGGSGGNGV